GSAAHSVARTDPINKRGACRASDRLRWSGSAEKRPGCGDDLRFAPRGGGTELLELLRPGVQLRVQDAERLRQVVDGRFERADPRLGCRELLVGLTEPDLQLGDETASIFGDRIV